MKYKVVWESRLYGESVVEASSPEEAKTRALVGEDTDFEQFDPDGDWEIESIEEVKPMKYLVTVETLTYQDYLVEAESEEEAKKKVLSGEEEAYGNADSGHDPQITNVEVYEPCK